MELGTVNGKRRVEGHIRCSILRFSSALGWCETLLLFTAAARSARPWVLDLTAKARIHAADLHRSVH